MQLLSERGDITEPRGQHIVSILLFEDLLIAPLLALVAILAPTEWGQEPTSPIWQRLGTAALSLARWWPLDCGCSIPCFGYWPKPRRAR
jgi:Kef-type K+ transport system membrane component KefB